MNSVDFPNFFGPIQLTDKPYEHFFASYYGINSFSANEQYATVLRTTIKDHLPNENEPATLGIVDIRKKSSSNKSNEDKKQKFNAEIFSLDAFRSKKED